MRRLKNYYRLDLFLPKSVNVAIRICCNGLFIRKSKGHGRLLTYLKAFALAASIGLEIYPNDMMLFNHRMFNGTNGYGYNVILYSYNRDVLFMACFNNARLKLGHLLTTAHHRNTCIVDHSNQITAMLTNVELIVITHNQIPPSIFLLLFYHKNLILSSVWYKNIYNYLLLIKHIPNVAARSTETIMPITVM